MRIVKKWLGTIALLVWPVVGGLASPPTAGADFMTYADRSSFNAASTGLTTIDFEGLASPGKFTYYGNPGSLKLNGVSFNTNGALFVQNNNVYGTGSILSPQQSASGLDVTDITLPAGVTAVGTNIFSADPITVTLATGQSYTIPGRTFPNLGFTGFTTDTPVSSLQFSVKGGLDLDNFAFGRAVAVPEPASFVMMGTGLVGILWYARRHRVKATPDRAAAP